MKEIIRRSPVGRMYETAMPAIVTLTIAENRIKTDSIGYWDSNGQNVGMSRRNYHKCDPAPFSLYDRTTTTHITFLTTKTGIRKNQENDSQTGSRAWTRQCLSTAGTPVWVSTVSISDEILGFTFCFCCSSASPEFGPCQGVESWPGHGP